MDHLNEGEKFLHLDDWKAQLRCSLPGHNDNVDRNVSDFWDFPDSEDVVIKEIGSPYIKKLSTSLNEFTQRWLFFELVGQVFEHLKIFNWDDFVDDSDGQA